MSEQRLFEYKNNISPALSFGDIEIELKSIFVDETLYSFIVWIKCDNECNVITYQIKHLVSDCEQNNTIFFQDAINTIINALIEHRNYKGKTKVICYKQPPIDLMVELYEPLVETLAKNIQMNWQQYDLDDLKQICRMCMVELYNKGYYLHKRLLKKTFNRRILQEVRGLKHRGEIVSLYQKCTPDNGEDEVLMLKDMLEDTDATIREQERLRLEGEMEIFKEIKDIIVSKIGERRWDMLFRDYGKGHTTNTTRAMMSRLKQELEAEGYTRKLFNRRYH